MHGSNETVAKLARFLCGRAIKPVRPPMARRHWVLRQMSEPIYRVELGFATASNDPRRKKAKELPVNRAPFAEFLHSFLRPSLRAAGHSGPGVWTFRASRQQACALQGRRNKLRRWVSSRGSAACAWLRVRRAVGCESTAELLPRHTLECGSLLPPWLGEACFAIPSVRRERAVLELRGHDRPSYHRILRPN
jgi:hypothetical protein